MNPLDLVNIGRLMDLTQGDPDVMIALVDGPVADLPLFAAERVRRFSGGIKADCSHFDAMPCERGTFIAGILIAKRGSAAPALCPGCTLLVRPIFAESTHCTNRVPSTTPQELASAIADCVEAGARVINLSLGLSQPSSNSDRDLKQALDYAALRGTVVVAAAGNQGTIGSSAITRHHWPIPVGACDSRGRPLDQSNLAQSIGRRGLSSPGEGIAGIDPAGSPVDKSGTSVATAFVTGAIGLLWSEFVHASAAQIRFAITRSYAPRRRTIVPPLLNAWESYEFMAASAGRRKTA